MDIYIYQLVVMESYGYVRTRKTLRIGSSESLHLDAAGVGFF